MNEFKSTGNLINLSNQNNALIKYGIKSKNDNNNKEPKGSDSNTNRNIKMPSNNMLKYNFLVGSPNNLKNDTNYEKDLNSKNQKSEVDTPKYKNDLKVEDTDRSHRKNNSTKNKTSNNNHRVEQSNFSPAIKDSTEKNYNRKSYKEKSEPVKGGHTHYENYFSLHNNNATSVDKTVENTMNVHKKVNLADKFLDSLSKSNMMNNNNVMLSKVSKIGKNTDTNLKDLTKANKLNNYTTNAEQNQVRYSQSPKSYTNLNNFSNSPVQRHINTTSDGINSNGNSAQKPTKFQQNMIGNTNLSVYNKMNYTSPNSLHNNSSMPVFPEKNIGVASNQASEKNSNTLFFHSNKQNSQTGGNAQKKQEQKSFSANVNRDSTTPDSRNGSPIINICNQTPSTYDLILKQKQHMINTYTKANTAKKKLKNTGNNPTKNEYFTTRESNTGNSSLKTTGLLKADDKKFGSSYSEI